MRNLNRANFKKGASLSVVLAALLLGCSIALGKDAFFLMLNTDFGKPADYFFAAWTYAGDGALWIPVVFVVVFILKRKELLPLLIAGFVFSTLFTRIFKDVLVPGAARPYKAIQDHILIHTVNILGQSPHMSSSFPSGHTITAFTFYFLFCLMIDGGWWVIAGFILASLVGYSRIYLAQHFPLDVGAGIIFALFSVLLALAVQHKWQQRQKGQAVG